VGSVRGALIGSLVIGMADAFGRAYIPSLLSQMMPPQLSDPLGSSLISASAYILMALVLLFRPLGLAARA
jgi:branched-chain amino acid transport system permease protein